MWRLILVCVCALAALAPLESAGAQELTAREVAVVQAALTELGYLIKLPDGKSGPNTQFAVRRWQARIGEQETGVITREQYEKLRDVDPAKLNRQWAAVSVSINGAYEAVYGRQSGVAAIKAAAEGCKRRASSSKKCATTASFVDLDEPWPIVAYACKDGRGRYIVTTAARTYDEAVEIASQRAVGKGYTLARCKQLVAIDGAGNRY